MNHTSRSAEPAGRARDACSAELERPDLRRAAEAIERLGRTAPDVLRLVRGVTVAAARQDAVAALLSRLSENGLENEEAAVERLLLFRAALASLDGLGGVPVCASVKAMLCDEIQAWTALDGAGRERFRFGTDRFVDCCMLASLRRFPAGQFDWVRSGLPLSYLLGVRLPALPKMVLVTLAGLRGRSPVFFSHFGYRRIGSSLSEVEANRAYHRMARSMAMQPEVKGLVASSWFRSPDTHRVSPHLAWVNRVVVENGGCVAVHGSANPDCGVFERSATRRRLYERGSFRPTLGLVIWPRRALLSWAESHPEFAD